MFKNLYKNISFWRFIGKIIPASVLVIKENGDILYGNKFFCNLVNLNEVNLFHYMSKQCLEKFNKNMAQAILDNKIHSSEIKISKETTNLYFIYYLIPLGKSRFSIVLTNTTNIVNENKMYENIFNTVADPIFVKNEEHQYTYVNEAFAKSVGCFPKEILGKKSADFFPEKESSIFYQIDRKTFKTEKVTVNEEKFTNKISGERIISTKKAVFKTEVGDKILVGISRDVTEINEAKKCLNKQAKYLEKQVKKRTKELVAHKNDLENAMEKLKSLNSDLNCFAHICCHELREPLRTINSFSQLTLNDYIAGNNKNLSNFLKIIYDSSLRMDKIIHSILAYSTNVMHSNSMNLFSVGELVEEVLMMLSAQIQERKAIITYGDALNIYADRMQILQLFRNLIDNAIKFCDPSKTPVINISATQKNEYVYFQIKDNGIGISKKYHKEIFLPFKKFHSRSEGSQHGIGLNFCKRIVENHDGFIDVSSRENVGTTFKIVMPLQQAR
ncbi:MAG: PAS domain-containing sensor histidine kinase [Candidatus Paracaedibacteraceae bacterium]|nr:PAS domain-containing sensor histidine kinase [Candidatus Paracaedibacteraceae bacterium]